jgi:hypothetical protein
MEHPNSEGPGGIVVQSALYVRAFLNARGCWHEWTRSASRMSFRSVLAPIKIPQSGQKDLKSFRLPGLACSIRGNGMILLNAIVFSDAINAATGGIRARANPRTSCTAKLSKGRVGTGTLVEFASHRPLRHFV